MAVLVIYGLLTACGGGSAAISGWSGIKQLGVVGKSTLANSVATDTSGNVYVAGRTDGGLDGNTPGGGTDAFLTKYDSSGVRQFTKLLGVTGIFTQANSVATDAGGNVYIAGYTSGGLDGNTVTGTTDFFLTKYDSSGIKQYTKQLGVAGKSTSAASVATDAGGNVYVAGKTFGGLDGNTLVGMANFFLTKYDNNGVKLFTKQFGVAGKGTFANSVATDVGGNVYVAGYTTGGLDGNTLSGTQDFFLTKFNSSGAKLFTRQLGATGADTTGKVVAAVANGYFYVAGYTAGGLDGNTLTGTTDLFLTKFSTMIVATNTKQLGVAGANTFANSVATDTIGNVYVAGSTSGGLDGNILTGTNDFFLTKYDSNGNKLFTKQLGVTGTNTYGNSVATDPSGNVFVTGHTSGGLDGNTLTGANDFFVAKFNSDGVKQ